MDDLAWIKMCEVWKRIVLAIVLRSFNNAESTAQFPSSIEIFFGVIAKHGPFDQISIA